MKALRSNVSGEAEMWLSSEVCSIWIGIAGGQAQAACRMTPPEFRAGKGPGDERSAICTLQKDPHCGVSGPGTYPVIAGRVWGKPA